MNISFIRHSTANIAYCTIIPRLRYNDKVVDLPSTGIKILKDDWDLEKKRVLYTDPHYTFKNEQIADLEMQIVAIFNDFLRKKKPFTIHQIKEVLLNNGDELSFITVFDMYLTDVAENPKISQGTLTKYRNVRDCMLRFLISKKWQHILVDDFEELHFESYRNHLLRTMKFSDFTAHKRCQVIKQLAKWAKKRRLTLDNSIEHISLPEPKQKELIYLSQEQFEKLKNYKFKSKLKQEVADVFIVFCRTGFHYQDLKNVIQEHTAYEKKGIDGNLWIYKNRVKTDVTAKVPYFDEVIDILAKYGGWASLPIKSNSKMNDVLKIIAAELEFPDNIIEKLSVKAGRKTIADYLRNEEGWGTDELKILLGINNDKYVNCYSKADERKVVRAMLRMNENKQAK